MVTLAVLSHNHTMEAVEMNNANHQHHHQQDEARRPRKRQCRARVRFSQREPETRVFNNFEAMTFEQSKQVCEQIWYTRQEFDSFLADRLHTIRMWRAVHGNTRFIEPFYCIRGLEMYKSAQINAAVLQARGQHVQAVLQEQSRQKQQQQQELVGGEATTPLSSSSVSSLDWDQVAKAVSHRSVWAMRQASRLAMNDALEARDVWDMDALCNNSNSYAKRFSMPFCNSTAGTELPPNDTPSATIMSSTLRRLSLPMGSSLYDTTTTTGTTSTLTRRNSVDVQKLKEMNRQFLKSVTTNQTTHHGNNNKNSSTTSTTSCSLSHSNSLSLLLVRGRRMAMMQQQQQQQNHYAHNNNNEGTQEAPSLSTTIMARGALMAGLLLADDDSTTLSSLGGHPLRRDSLHGLLRESTRDL